MKEILEQLQNKGIDKIKFSFINTTDDRKFDIENNIEMLVDLYHYHNINPLEEIFNLALNEIK